MVKLLVLTLEIDARDGDIAILVPADLGEGRPVPPAVARGLAI